MIDRRTMAARIRDVDPVPDVAALDSKEIGAFLTTFGEKVAAAHAAEAMSASDAGRTSLKPTFGPDSQAHGGIDMANITTDRPRPTASAERPVSETRRGRWRPAFGFALAALLAVVGATGWWMGSSDGETASAAAPPTEVQTMLDDFYAAFAANDGAAMAELLAEDFVMATEFAGTLRANDFARYVDLGETTGWAIEPVSDPLMIGEPAEPLQPQCVMRLGCDEPGAYVISVDVQKRRGSPDEEGFSMFFIVEEDGVPKVARYEYPLPYYLPLTMTPG